MSKEKVKKPIYKKWWVWLIAVIVVVGIATSGEEDTETVDSGTNAAESDETNNSSADSNENAEEGESDEENESEVTSANVGDSAEIADVSFTVNEVESTQEISSGNEFIDPVSTDGQFIILDITVQNDKKESITIDSSYFKLVTEDGTEFDPTTDGDVMMAMMEEDDFFLQQVNPGLSKTGKVVFEVGADVDLSTSIMKGQTGFWGTETVEISLAQ